VTRLVPGGELDKNTRKRLARLVQAVAGDMSERGAQLAAERITVLAPPGHGVTPQLVAFVNRAIAMAVSRCPRCLDPSVGLCSPCRGEHAREVAAAQRGESPPAPEEPPSSSAVDVDVARSCASKSRYATEKIANRVRHRCEETRGRPLRVYACFVCGGYHLTSRMDPPSEAA
jgi:hypothetical protein